MDCVVRILGCVSRWYKVLCIAYVAIFFVVAGCATFRSGEVPLASLEATVGVKVTESNETSTSVGGDMSVGGDSTGGSIIGGGGDSVALWMAILCLAAQPITAVAGALLYQHMLRPRRIRKENGANGN